MTPLIHGLSVMRSITKEAKNAFVKTQSLTVVIIIALLKRG
jgi:hypothetical protein